MKVTRGTPLRVAVLALSCVVLLLACFASISWGSAKIPLGEVVSLLLHPDDSYTSYTVNEARVTRTWLGAVIGVALGVSGAVMQAVTRNPLAEPGLLGVNSGAALSIVLGISLAGVTAPSQQFVLASIGACIAAVIVYAVGSSGFGGASPVRLVLAGAAFSAASSGIITLVLLLRPRVFEGFRYWDVGALTRLDMPMWVVVVPILVGLVLVLASAKGLSNIALGDDVATALGTNVAATRATALLALTLMCAAATAAAGPISFVGLMVPLFASWCLGPHRGWIIVVSAVMGASLVLGTDVVGRIIARPGEIQVGLLTAFVGSPALLWMVSRLRGDAR